MTSAGSSEFKQCDAALTAILRRSRAVVDKNAELHRVLTGHGARKSTTAASVPQIATCLNCHAEIFRIPRRPMHGRDENLRASPTPAPGEDRPAMDSRPNAAVRRKGRTSASNMVAPISPAERGSRIRFYNNHARHARIHVNVDDGEARTRSQWPEGGGAPREVLASKNDTLGRRKPASTSRRQDDDIQDRRTDKFKSGTISKSPKPQRSHQGAIQIDPTKTHFTGPTSEGREGQVGCHETTMRSIPKSRVDGDAGHITTEFGPPR